MTLGNSNPNQGTAEHADGDVEHVEDGKNGRKKIVKSQKSLWKHTSIHFLKRDKMDAANEKCKHPKASPRNIVIVRDSL